MKNKRYIIITATLMVFIIGLIVISSKKTYSASTTTYSREYLQDVIISTGLSYFYNNQYSDYGQTPMDNGAGYDIGDYKYETVYWRDLNTTPEMVSRGNYYHIDCSGFAFITYLNAIGYDMSDYANLLRYRLFYYDKDPKAFRVSDLNISDTERKKYFKDAYQIFGQAWNNRFSTIVANYISGHCNSSTCLETDDNGVLYDGNDSKSELVYYYILKDTDDRRTIMDSVVNKLQKGDLLFTFNDDGTGHVMLYVGDTFNAGEKGFLHSTGADWTNDENEAYDRLIQHRHSVRYDNYEYDESDPENKNSVIYRNLASKVGFKIFRPLNTICNGDTCNVKLSDNAKAREELNRLNTEQYAISSSKDNKVITKYNSLNRGDEITYKFIINNKTIFRYYTDDNGYVSGGTYCPIGSTSSHCTTTSTSDKVYNGLRLTGEIPDGTEFVSCTNDCTQSGNIVTWNLPEMSKDNVTTFTYTYTVKVNSDINIDNSGMELSLPSGNKLKMANITTNVNPTINNSNGNDIAIKNTIDLFKSLVESGKITYSGSGVNSENLKDLNNLDSASVSSYGFIKMIYYNAFGINLNKIGDVNNTNVNIRNNLFNVIDVNSVNIYAKKKTTENNTYIEKMLVPGMYGGTLLKGNDNLDRMKILEINDFEIGDIIISYHNNGISSTFYMVYDIDSNGVKLAQFTTTDGSPKLFIYDNDKLKESSTNAGDAYYNNPSNYTLEDKPSDQILNELFGKELFVVLRPSRLYGGVIYDANGGSGEPSSQTKVHGTNLTLSSEIPTRNGYTFKGWSTSSSATKATYSSGGSYADDKVTTKLYAVWSKDNSHINIEETSDYTLKGEFIMGIKSKTNINNFSLGLDNNYTIKILDRNNNVKTSGYIGTGYKVQIYLEDDLIDEYVAIIKGDINSDGDIKVSDVAKLYRGLKKKITLADYEIEAGNIVNDDILKINDIAKLYRYIKGKISIL